MLKSRRAQLQIEHALPMRGSRLKGCLRLWPRPCVRAIGLAKAMLLSIISKKSD